MKRRRTVVTVAWICVVLLSVVTGLALGRHSLVPPTVEASKIPLQTYTVTEGTVSLSRSYGMTATWKRTLIGVGAASGTVTTTSVSPGALVHTGAELYTVNLRPVVIAEGAVPAFRQLSEGTEGTDVEQLQTLLKQYLLLGKAKTGLFDAATTGAVKKWQKSLGMPQDGIVQSGDLIFTPTLPTRVVLDDKIQVGNHTESGSPAVYGLGSSPDFFIDMSASSQQVPPVEGQEVSVAIGEGTWHGIVGPLHESPPTNDSEMPDDSRALYSVTSPDGGPLCADGCDQIAITTIGTSLIASVAIVPETTGPIVPLAALGTDSSGATFVLTLKGDRILVTVQASDGGRSIVEGISPGDVIRLFGNET